MRFTYDPRYNIELSLSVLLWAGVSFARPPEDPYLMMRGWQPYRSYAGERYELYPAFGGKHAVYDRLGNFIGYGPFGFRWDEVRDKYIDEKLSAGLQVNRTPSTSRTMEEAVLFGGLSVVRQAYGGRAISFSLGRNMITTFTPLVLYQLAFSGLRVDYGSHATDFTFLLSRGGFRGYSRFSDFYGSQQGRMEMSPVIMVGANYVRRFDTFDIGLCFFRQLQSNVKSSKESLFRGDVPYPELRSPKLIKVRMTDDSPRDLPGAALYRADIIIVGTDPSGRVVKLASSPSLAGPGVRYSPVLKPSVVGRRTSGRWEAQGEGEAVDVLFEMPPDLILKEAEVVLVVSGDYRIGVRQVHDFQVPGSKEVVERSWPSPAPAPLHGLYFKDTPFDPEPFYTIMRVEGNPHVNSRPRTVRFHHSIPTAQSFYGANLHLHFEELNLDAELVYNPQDFKFPTEPGVRNRRSAYAGYLTAVFNLGRFGRFGGEVFRVDPTYGGWYDSRRGGIVLFTDVAGDVRAGDSLGVEALTQEYPFYDDNDDHDNWPDDVFKGWDWMYVPAGAFKEPSMPGRRPDAGVYPGLDMDGDLILDYDRNRNAIEDWKEPFLGFGVDPPEFSYGTDFNNNFIPDYMENDDEPDYPYRRDQVGFHFFYDLGPLPYWAEVRFGCYRIEEIAGGGISKGAYLRFGFGRDFGKWSFSFKDELKLVKDDIPDDVYRTVLTMDPDVSLRWNTANNPPPPDFLPMRDSFVNTGFLRFSWSPFEGLNLKGTVKYLLNRRRALRDRLERRIQDRRTLKNLSSALRASYTRNLTRRLKAELRLRFLLADWDEGSYSSVADSLSLGREARWYLLAPSLLLSYSLTSKTSLEFGQYGFLIPPLSARFADQVDRGESFREDVSVLQVTVRGAHEGYNVAGSVGVRWRNRRYHRLSPHEDVKFSAFFADFVFGPE